MSRTTLRPGIDYPGIGVGAFMSYPDRIDMIFVKRGSEARNEQGLWDLPGGGKDPLETPEEAILREIMEETSLSAKIIYQIGAFSHILPDQEWMVILYLCEVLPDEFGGPKPIIPLSESGKIAQIKEFSHERIEQMLTQGLVTQSTVLAWKRLEQWGEEMLPGNLKHALVSGG